jgi:6,7-dimethyl-8-ribityllumazine synthase
MVEKFEGDLEGKGLRIGVVISKFNEPIVENLLKGALLGLENNGVSENDIKVFFVPGAFEIPIILKKLCTKNDEYKMFDGFITLGCVIKGDTAHFEYISSAVTEGVNKINIEHQIPTAFCVLTCYTPLQAYERSGNPPTASNNKGYEAALSLLEMINVMKKI